MQFGISSPYPPIGEILRHFGNASIVSTLPSASYSKRDFSGIVVLCHAAKSLAEKLLIFETVLPDPENKKGNQSKHRNGQQAPMPQGPSFFPFQEGDSPQKYA
jgi:hypothetical protein